MKPKPFAPQVLDSDPHFVRERHSGLVYHRCRQRVLYADTDRSQMVYHANYLRYFEFGRASLMRHSAFPYREIEDSGYVYPIIKVGVDYYRPLQYDDAFWIFTRPADLERVRLQFDYVIVREADGDLICRGITRHCAVNSAGTPVEVDPKTMHLWQHFPR
jgi:acyl-CoA thioester hydrolase